MATKKAGEYACSALAEIEAFIDEFYEADDDGGSFDNGSDTFTCEIIGALPSFLGCEAGFDENEVDADLDEMLGRIDKSFAQMLFEYIDRKGVSDVDAYKLSNVDKKTFSKIKCNKDYRPSKKTAISFAIGLKLDYDETQRLLASLGMCLSRSNKFDLIIEYFVKTGKYKTILDVNEALYHFNEDTLGV